MFEYKLKDFARIQTTKYALRKKMILSWTVFVLVTLKQYMNKSKQSSIAHYYCHLFRVNCKEHCFILNYEFLKSYFNLHPNSFFFVSSETSSFWEIDLATKKKKTHTDTHQHASVSLNIQNLRRIGFC